ncbi:D-tyrosyl-tRNA(Tyr) deacylase [candidate division LCP-89 bacterium B3_LCP]|uniref:D-aminoacyl-tRNA deacylase n=1 Tax=candidate division LCP-89 bacterium B3_LCP TaxID=2012998 RepID=A0A532V5W3_UNCL8|nr:MAG: D-tyrosyl-tRNA(Tyr) deacylase [candidate division LCP-89 bacterium B3_LCP]
MIVIYQRVNRAEVRVGEEITSAIGRGALLLVGIKRDDDSEVLRWMAKKVAGLRVHDDQDGKLNLSLEEIGGEVLAVSQFTLLGDCRRGKRPSFTRAAPPDIAEPLFIRFVELLKEEGIPVQIGAFGEHMQVELVNDGPVTLMLEYP